jgi:tetratricopeptide (TPR) repeat protein
MRILRAACLALCLAAPSAAADDFDYNKWNIENSNKEIASGKLKGGELADAYASRGFSYADQKRYKQALADYDRAIKIGGEMFTPVHYHRAKLLWGMGRKDAALQDLDAHMLRRPEGWKDWAVRDAAKARKNPRLCRNNPVFMTAIKIALDAENAFAKRDMKAANTLADGGWKAINATVDPLGRGEKGVTSDAAIGYGHAVSQYERKGQLEWAASEKLEILKETLMSHGDEPCVGPAQ